MEGSMEEAIKERPSAPPPVSAGKTTTKLRYPLRSATKSKEDKSSIVELTKSSASKRGRPPPSSVAKSVSVLDLSGKNKSSSAKPPRRLSVPSKSTPSPHPRPVAVGNISPISEANRTKRLFGSQAKNGTPPLSDYSRSSSSSTSRKNLLSSTSYWLSHIKQSESAAKHNISLGFFKLALEAGCEPIQKMRDELKSYARRHNIVVLGEATAAKGKELFESYNMSEHFEQLNVSDTSSQVPEDGRSRSSSDEDDVRSSSSITGGGREVKTRSLKALTTTTSSSSKAKAAAAGGEANNNNTTKKEENPGTKTIRRVSTSSRKATPTPSAANKTAGSASERRNNLDKNSQMKKKPRKHEMDKANNNNNDNSKIMANGKGEVDNTSSPTKDVVGLHQENKENLMEEMSLTSTTIQV